MEPSRTRSRGEVTRPFFPNGAERPLGASLPAVRFLHQRLLVEQIGRVDRELERLPHDEGGAGGCGGERLVLPLDQLVEGQRRNPVTQVDPEEEGNLGRGVLATPITPLRWSAGDTISPSRTADEMSIAVRPPPGVRNMARSGIKRSSPEMTLTEW
ncbi:hypothetical protein [Micromonospora sp. IBHARD004]|uniref:hypothetical protein n=1 Tax=Micromonospora sp. IBHARD004 TaxID=3457764 RepID=UPI004057D4ED